MITGVHAADHKRDRNHDDHNQDGDEVRSDESERDSREDRIQAADRCKPHETVNAEIRLKMFLDALISYRLHNQADTKSEEDDHRKDLTEEPFIRHRIAFAEQIRKKMPQKKCDQLADGHQDADSRQKFFIYFTDQ